MLVQMFVEILIFGNFCLFMGISDQDSDLIPTAYNVGFKGYSPIH